MDGVIHKNEPTATRRPIVIAERDEGRGGVAMMKTNERVIDLPVPSVNQNSGVMKPVQKD